MKTINVGDLMPGESVSIPFSKDGEAGDKSTWVYSSKTQEKKEGPILYPIPQTIRSFVLELLALLALVAALGYILGGL